METKTFVAYYILKRLLVAIVHPYLCDIRTLAQWKGVMFGDHLVFWVENGILLNSYRIWRGTHVWGIMRSSVHELLILEQYSVVHGMVE